MKDSHLEKYTGTGRISVADDIPEQAPDDKLERLLPAPGDSYYVAYRARAKGCKAFNVLRPDGTASHFVYPEHTSGGSYKPGEIVMRFIGYNVLIRGRNLFEIYDLMCQHLVIFIRVAVPNRDYELDEKEPYITEVLVIEAQEDKRLAE